MPMQDTILKIFRTLHSVFFAEISLPALFIEIDGRQVFNHHR